MAIQGLSPVFLQGANWCQARRSRHARGPVRLRELIKTPILLGEHICELESMATLVLKDGADFVRADPDFEVGINGTMKIAHFAEALGLDVEIHAPGPAHRHCIAVIRNTNFYEFSPFSP